jgi:WD40 repeat protein
MIWDLATKTEVAKLYGPHKDSVLDFVWSNSLVVSGDKNGTVALWVKFKFINILI